MIDFHTHIFPEKIVETTISFLERQCGELIATDEPPVNAIRKKKDSSIVVGMNLVKKGEADAFVSAGSSLYYKIRILTFHLPSQKDAQTDPS